MPPAVSSAAISVVVSTDQQVKAPVYTRTFRDASRYTDVIRGLAPNTTYYLRVEEINTRPDYPAGVLSRMTTSFRTGADSLSSGWSFINGGSRLTGHRVTFPLTESGQYGRLGGQRQRPDPPDRR